MIRKSSSLLYVLLLLVCSRGVIAPAQEYRVRAVLNAAPATGFYRIPVTAELSGYANNDLSDIRIADSNVFVPYINSREILLMHPASFTRFSISSNTADSNYSTIDLERPTHDAITALSLVIRNTSVERYTMLSGSDDKTHWYIIDEHILFQPSGSSNGDNYIQTIHFPQTSYKYLRLKINNAHTDPLNIVDAGIFKRGDVYTAPGLTQNPAPAYTQKDSSNHITYVVIRNKAPYLTGQLQLAISGPRFYNRNATVYVLAGDKDSSRLTYETGTFTLSSALPPVVTIKSQKALSVILAIDNKDNPPLKINGITTLQEQQYLIAWLEKGKTYTLLACNPQATPPDYDLARFKDSIPAQLTTLEYDHLTTTTHIATTPATHSSDKWLWPIIIIAVAVMGFLTWRLMKDMKGGW